MSTKVPVTGITTQESTMNVLDRVSGLGFVVVQTEALRNYDGKPGVTLAQGQ